MELTVGRLIAPHDVALRVDFTGPRVGRSWKINRRKLATPEQKPMSPRRDAGGNTAMPPHDDVQNRPLRFGAFEFDIRSASYGSTAIDSDKSVATDSETAARPSRGDSGARRVVSGTMAS